MVIVIIISKDGILDEWRSFLGDFFVMNSNGRFFGCFLLLLPLDLFFRMFFSVV